MGNDKQTARCLRCGSEMGQTEAVCPKCGEGQNAERLGEHRRGLHYSETADFFLMIGQCLAGLGAVVALVGCVLALLSGEWADALLRGPVAFFFLAALYVVFARASDRSA